MGNSNHAKTLYTKQTRLYQWLFIDLLGWGRRLKTFFQGTDYLRSNIKVLDAGCGTGVVTKVLYGIAKDKDFTDIHFDAFDLTPAMLDIFREWTAKQNINIQLAQADVLDLNLLPPEWRNYDLIVSAGMLEYIPKQDMPKALGNLRNLLKDGGALLIFITRRNSLTRWFIQGLWKANVYEEIEIKQILEKSGFSIVTFKKPLFTGWLNSTIVMEMRK